MKLIILITTFKRPKKLLSLLKQIYEQQQNKRIKLIVFEDFSTFNYENTKSFFINNFSNSTWFKASQHFGKPNYWLLIENLYKNVKEEDSDYIIQLPDDIGLVDDFFNQAITQFNQIKDPKKICLNLLQDNRTSKPLWTPVKQINKGEVFKVGWVDMCFIATKRFFKTLNYSIEPVSYSWSNNKNLSSGVGMQISKRLYKKYNLYQVKKSLVIHGIHDSVMHPEHRKITPLITNHMKDKVIAGLATMPERIKSLEETVNSILPQIDELHVYLNDFSTIPKFLKGPTIKIFRSEKEIGNIGDVGKFYTCEKIKGYHFTIDDDLIYPANYVSTFINEIERYQRKAVIGIHGRLFDKIPTHSYYHGFSEAYSCLRKVAFDKRVHIIGTGALAYHTDTIQFKLSDFETSNMGDIWFSLKANKLKVPLVVIKHANGWLKESEKYDKDYTIYNFCHRKEQMQTEIINSHNWQIPVL